MPDDPLIPVQIAGAAGHLAWANGGRFRLPLSVLTDSGLIEGLRSNGTLDLPREIPRMNGRHVDVLRLRAAFTDHPPASSRLPVSYRRIPGPVRSLVAAVIGRWKRRQVDRWAAFPRWPMDLSADLLADLAGGRSTTLATGPTPVVLTHDADSSAGLQNLVERFLGIEEGVGARSTCFIVPCSWPLDHGLLRRITQSGHALGIHGYDHSNRTPFLGLDQQRQRLERARGLLDRYDIHGYRSPSLLRTPSLLRAVGEWYAYDSSIPTSGGLFPVPNNGCASARPFMVEGIRELPLSLPRDGSLRFLGHRCEEVLQLWIECAERIARSGGVVVLLTHGEARFSGNPGMLEVYRQFLSYLAESDRFAWSTPDEVLERALPTVDAGGHDKPGYAKGKPAIEQVTTREAVAV